MEFDEVQHLGMHYELRESVDCLRHQLETARAALAQRDERIGELEAELDSYRQRMELAEQYHDQAEAEIVELRRAINGIAPTDPTRFEDLDLCVALNNHADLAAVLSWLQRLAPAGSPQPGGPAQFAQWVVESVQRDFAAVAPVVRAAMEQEDHHSDAARHYPHDPRDLCACGVCVQVRSLPAAVLERMGVDR